MAMDPMYEEDMLEEEAEQAQEEEMDLEDVPPPVDEEINVMGVLDRITGANGGDIPGGEPMDLEGNQLPED
jgi:hypothetical protein